jgi:LCP family protein required for cell wall assembly
MSGSNQGEDDRPEYDRPGSGRGARRGDPRRDQPAPRGRGRPGPPLPPTRLDQHSDDFARGDGDGYAPRSSRAGRGEPRYDGDRYGGDRYAGPGYRATPYGGGEPRGGAGTRRSGADPYGADPDDPGRYDGDRYDGDRYDGDRYQSDPYAPDRSGGRGGYPPPPAADPVAGAPARPARSATRLLAGAIAIAVLGLSVSGWSLLQHYNGRVHHISLVVPGKRPPDAARGARNILLVGSDSRAGTSGQFGEVDGQRSDTTMLAHLSPDGATTMLSFPRDLWVTLPAYTDSSGRSHPAQKSKLNAAFSFGGPSLLVRTIESITNIRIDNYVQIDFVGFQAMTDALGGVTVCVKELPASLKAEGFDNLNDKMSGWHGHVGLNTLDGEQALAFVRQRYGLPGSDLDRIRRQQQFIGAIFRESLSSAVLMNPSKVVHLLNAATSALTVDQGTSLADLRVLALHLRAVDSGGVTFATVPANPGSAGGQSVLIIDQAGLATQLRRLTGSSGSSALSDSANVGSVVPMRLAAAQAPLGASAAADETSAAATTPASGSCTY